MDDGIVNWGEYTEAEETNHVLMAISSSNEVSLCSKTCIDSYNKLKILCNEQMNQLGDQEAQILGDPKSAVQTRSKVQNKSGAHALLSHIHKQQRNNHKDQQHYLFACFLSQKEPQKIAEALQDDSWVQAMQEELLQFKLQQVWVLVDLPHVMKMIVICKLLITSEYKAAKDSHLLLLPMTICANTAAKDVNKSTKLPRIHACFTWYCSYYFSTARRNELVLLAVGLYRWLVTETATTQKVGH
ncbi:hypothetical protein Tco_1348445 [Tanacetum coccineum]